MNKGIKLKLVLICLIVAASGCTQLPGNSMAMQPQAELIGKVSDGKITNSSPGEIKLNAQNYVNRTTFHVKVRPVGDYSQVAEVTNRQDNEIIRVELGSAVEDATTGQQFVEVHKRLNISSTVKVKAELYNQTGNIVLDEKIYVLRSIEG